MSTLELLSEVHLARLAYLAPPEEARKVLEAHAAAVKKRFKSQRTAPSAVRRAFGVIAAALAALTWRQAEAAKDGLPNADGAAQVSGCRWAAA